MANKKIFIKKYKDKLKGGKADKKKPSSFDPKQLKAGIKVEMEHTDDPEKAKEIAMDHLTEDKDYYKDWDNKEKILFQEKAPKLKKSEAGTYTFPNAHAVLDAGQQHHAEQFAYPPLVSYIKNSLSAEINKIKMAKGTLTLYAKDKGLYDGFFQDQDGQIVTEFDSTTPEIVAKTLEIKELYKRPQETPAPGPADDEAVREMAREEAQAVVEDTPRTYVKVKYGDFELEIRKSLSDFISTFKKARKPNYITSQGMASNHTANSFIRSYKMKAEKKKRIKKALQSWARNTGRHFNNDLEAARELLADWERCKEEFQQILYAAQQLKNEKNR